MALPVDFIVVGTPVSQQARRKGRLREWQQQVQQSAKLRWSTEDAPIAGPVRLEITHFYLDIELDLDNLLKPVIDALKELIYLDDRQVTDLLCRKRSLRSGLRVENPSSVLAEGLNRGNDFLYVALSHAPDQEALD